MRLCAVLGSILLALPCASNSQPNESRDGFQKGLPVARFFATHPMKTHSRLGIWVRGILITLAATLTYLINDPTFRSLVAPIVLTVVGTVTVAVITIRGYIDESPAQGNKEPVPVTNAEGEALKTKDVNENTSN